MSIQTLGKQSLIYGFGHILTRLVTFFLLPLYTHIFTVEEYGVVSLAYAFMGFSLILYRYGMDTALMKYAVQKEGQERGEYISTIYGLQVISSVIFSCILFFSRNTIAKIVLGVDKPEWIALLSGVLLLDALWNLPVLLLRTEEKPVSFIAFNLIISLYITTLVKLFHKPTGPESDRSRAGITPEKWTKDVSWTSKAKWRFSCAWR